MKYEYNETSAPYAAPYKGGSQEDPGRVAAGKGGINQGVLLISIATAKMRELARWKIAVKPKQCPLEGHRRSSRDAGGYCDYCPNWE